VSRRFRLLLIQMITVEDDELSLDDISDSFMDNVLDEQGEPHETSDDRVSYFPQEIVDFEILEEKQ
jgi:hypothetical protein